MKYCPEGVYIDRRQPHGLGDTVASTLQRLKVQNWITKILKKVGIGNCGCLRRKVWLNKAFPYDMAIWRERLVWAWRALWRA